MHKEVKGGMIELLPFIHRKEANMKILDKIRTNRKLVRIYRVIRQLPQADQAECIEKIQYCLNVSDDKRMKEKFLDMVIERFDALCQ